VLISGLSIAALCIGVVDLARSAGDPTSFFIIGRFAAPAGYANAACALYVFAAWPLAYAAARREPPAVVRGALLACATALVELAVLTQSRGSLFAVPVAVVAYLVIVPYRLRAALAVAAVGITTYLARAPLLDVFDAVRLDRADAGDAIHSALGAIGLSFAAVLVGWTLIALLDRRVSLSERGVRIANGAALGVVVLAVAAGAFALSSVDVGAKWRSFKGGYPAETGGSHFSIGLGSNRYDFWRVAVRQFRDRPLTGAGADNFADDYVRERRSSEEPLYPHSLVLRIPAQLGVVGSLLFLAFVVAAALAVTRASAFADGVARAGVAAAVYYAIHGSGDWLWEFAGLGAPAFAWLGLAASRPAPVRRPGTSLRIVATATALVAALSFVFPWLAALEARRAAQVWTHDPVAAFAALHRSHRLNPLSARADLLAGAIASRKGDIPRMARAFESAANRTPDDWYAHLELGIAYAALHDRRRALAQLARSKQLNPGEEALRIVRREVLAGRRIDRHQIDQLFVNRVRSRVGP
jgi:O-antigen ligase